MSEPSLKLEPTVLTTFEQYGLAIHTSSPDLGLAITDLTGNIRTQTWDVGRDLSTHLHLHLAAFLQPQVWAELAFIAVAQGPGGFTGTRLGVVTARTLAQQLKIPLFGISSLAALAQADGTNQRLASELEPVQTAIAVQIQAQRGEVCGAIYQTSSTGLQTLFAPAVMSQTQWQQTLKQWHSLSLVTATDRLGYTASSLLELALVEWRQGHRPNWSQVLPFYGQHPVTTTNA